MFVEVSKRLAAGILTLALVAGSGWAKGANQEKVCAVADRIKKSTDNAIKDADKYKEAKKAREKSEGEHKKATDEEEQTQKKIEPAKKELQTASTAVEKKLGEIAAIAPQISAAAALPLEQSQPKIAELTAQKKKLEGEHVALKEEEGKKKDALKKAEDDHAIAADALKKADTDLGTKTTEEKASAKARVKAAQGLLKEHHRDGKTAMRCNKYQVTGAGSALWQTWKTGTKTLTAALDNQQQLFEDAGTKSVDERVADAVKLAKKDDPNLGGFESGTASAKRFEKNIRDRIEESDAEREARSRTREQNKKRVEEERKNPVQRPPKEVAKQAAEDAAKVAKTPPPGAGIIVVPNPPIDSPPASDTSPVGVPTPVQPSDPAPPRRAETDLSPEERGRLKQARSQLRDALEDYEKCHVWSFDCSVIARGEAMKEADRNLTRLEEELNLSVTKRG